MDMVAARSAARKRTSSVSPATLRRIQQQTPHQADNTTLPSNSVLIAAMNAAGSPLHPKPSSASSSSSSNFAENQLPSAYSQDVQIEYDDLVSQKERERISLSIFCK